jgi:hypothetical protein
VEYRKRMPVTDASQVRSDCHESEGEVIEVLSSFGVNSFAKLSAGPKPRWYVLVVKMVRLLGVLKISALTFTPSHTPHPYMAI